MTTKPELRLRVCRNPLGGRGVVLELEVPNATPIPEPVLQFRKDLIAQIEALKDYLPPLGFKRAENCVRVDASLRALKPWLLRLNEVMDTVWPRRFPGKPMRASKRKRSK